MKDAAHHRKHVQKKVIQASRKEAQREWVSQNKEPINGVTFEFETAAQITEKGYAKGTSVRTVAARALDDATEKNKNVNWSYLVVVLERIVDEIESLPKVIEEDNLT